MAVLAGVSASWYTWLEQGRDIKVSGDVLDSVSRALNLDHTERAHLYLLAGVNPPTVSREMTSQEISWFQLVVEGWQPAPAFVVDRYWNTLVTNAHARALLGVRDTDYNFLWSFFTDVRNRSRYPCWLDEACRLVGLFRVQAAHFPDDPNFERLARRLCAESPQFDRLWTQHETQDSGIATVEIRVAPDLRIQFDNVTLGLHQRSEPMLMLYTPAPTAADPAGCSPPAEGRASPADRAAPRPVTAPPASPLPATRSPLL